MAERKTFLFFCGWAEVLADFSPEDRCAVYDAIIAYAEDGTLPSLNPVGQMAFKFIKKDIDEMQSKYEATCEKRREAANKRWQMMKKQSDDTNGTKDTIASNLCNSMHEHDLHYKHEHKHEHKHKHEHEHEHEKNIDKSNSSTTNIARMSAGAEEAASSLGTKIAELKGREIWLEQMAMKFHITTDEVCRLLDEFREDMELRGKQVSSPQSLFVTWMGDHRCKAKTKVEATEPGLGIGEFRNSKGQRTYASSGVVVPDNAPPRPSAAHWWSETTNRWEKTI